MKKKVKRANKEVLDWVKSHVANIVWLANLDDYSVSICSSNGIDKKDKMFGEMHGKTDTMAMMDTDHTYLTAYMAYQEETFVKGYKDKAYSFLIGVLCHEVSHIITSEALDEYEIKDEARDIKLQERLTERVGRLVYRLYIKWMRDNNIDPKTCKPIKPRIKRKKK